MGRNAAPARPRGREQTARAGTALHDLSLVAARHARKLGAVSPHAAPMVQLSLVPAAPRPRTIFLFIAGTYTPFTVGQMHGERVGPMVAVWAGAVIGPIDNLWSPVRGSSPRRARHSNSRPPPRQFCRSSIRRRATWSRCSRPYFRRRTIFAAPETARCSCATANASSPWLSMTGRSRSPISCDNGLGPDAPATA